MDIQEQIANLAAPAATAAGLVVDDVHVSRAGKHTRVLVTLDLPETEIGSASLDAVAEASRGIGQALDEADVPSSAYTLEVSTPGTDRELTEPRHFMRARTRKVELDMADGTTHTGRLTDVADNALVVDVDDTEQSFPLAEVQRGRIIVELRRLDSTPSER